MERAAVAVFIFKERVGKVTWEELNNCRNRPIEKRIPTLVLFSSMPPIVERLTDREVARSWADLLDRKSELIEDWTYKDSRSVTPLESYRDINHLKEIFMKKINALLPSLIIGNDPTALIQDRFAQVQIISDAIPSNYLDSIADLVQFDTQAVQQYRSLMRSNARLALPSTLQDDEFLRRAGYLKGERLTIGGALLFTSSPSKVIPSALIRCSKYDGEDKATSRNWHNCDGPLLTQILEARDFIANNVGHREEPVDSSMQSSTTYEYPMVCIREILANAVCHRNYEDQERLIYVTIYNNRIEIKSPGNWCSTSLPEEKAVALSQLVSESVQRNMRLAHAISSVGMMEVEGSGILTAVNDCINCSAPKPLVVERNGYVIVTIYPSEFWDTDIDEGVTAQQDGHQEPLVDVKLDNQLRTKNKGTEEALQRALEEVSRLKNQLQEENIYLQEEISLEHNFNEIIGRSDEIKYVLFILEQVAPTDSTVLITGETGTGKELVARAIHSASPRRNRPLVKVNCAALSASLIESELFGHEKGAFTGATSRKTGRFELADGATIFLDEIGELPLELQSKLLRVIQEGEFERLGSSRTIKADVRIIAATNRNLHTEMREGRFREDLWYRLNVFPINVPPLRQHKEDIPILVEHFVKRLSKKLGREIVSVAPETLRTLTEYSWPGNVRELANVVERAVINTRGPVLRLSDTFAELPLENLIANSKSLEEVEREHIVRVLEDTGWRIEGSSGAAMILGLNPSTLRTRMVKLGIKKMEVEQDSQDQISEQKF